MNYSEITELAEDAKMKRVAAREERLSEYAEDRRCDREHFITRTDKERFLTRQQAIEALEPIRDCKLLEPETCGWIDDIITVLSEEIKTGYSAWNSEESVVKPEGFDLCPGDKVLRYSAGNISDLVEAYLFTDEIMDALVEIEIILDAEITAGVWLWGAEKDAMDIFIAKRVDQMDDAWNEHCQEIYDKYKVRKAE